MKTRSVGRGPLVVLAASAAAVLLGGCGSVPPGAASVINGSTVSRSDVNELAEAQCAGLTKASTTGQQAQSTARRQLTQQALTLLMDIELNLQYGKAKDITPRPEEVAATYSQVDPLIKQLPEKYQSFMSDTFHRWAAGRDVIMQAGEAATGQQATANNTDQLLQAGYQQRDPWLKKADIDTDPRYGPSDAGWPGGSDPSVSKAVSSFARSAGKSQPDPAWVSALPASQKCG